MTIPNDQPLILIVDDVASNIELLRVAMAGMAELIFATDGQLAVALARARRPDVVLLDIEMPDMNGYAVARAIHAEPGGAEIAVIFVTGHDQARYELPALLEGGVDFLSKPLNVPVARARVRTQLALRMRSRELAQARDELASLLRYLPAFVSHWDGQLCNRFAMTATAAGSASAPTTCSACRPSRYSDRRMGKWCGVRCANPCRRIRTASN